MNALLVNELQLLNALFGFLLLPLVFLSPLFLFLKAFGSNQLLLSLTTLLGLLNEALTIIFFLLQILLVLLMLLRAKDQRVLVAFFLLNVVDQLLRETFVTLLHLFDLLLVLIRQHHHLAWN